MVNLERIRNQILLAEKSLASGDKDMTFAHSYIPHSVIYPSIKDHLNVINSQSASQLEALLTDIPVSIRSEENVQLQDKLQRDLTAIMQLLDNISKQGLGQQFISNQTFIANTVVFLLRDLEQSYRLSNAAIIDQQNNNNNNNNNNNKTIVIIQQFSKVDYENALGLVNMSKSNYEKLTSSLDESRRQEINSFFNQLEHSIIERTNIEPISQLVVAIERDLAEYLSISSDNEGTTPTTSEHLHYFTTIKNLLSDVVTEVKQNGDYRNADKAAMTAYLDNYEYLEAPIEKLNATLMVDIEVDMREELRDMLKEKQSPAEIESFVDGILVKLSMAEQLLDNDSSLTSQNQTSAATTHPRVC